MTLAVKMPDLTATPSALDDLSAAMKADMNAVNALIIENMQSSVPLIPQLAGYLIASGGKRIRPLMTLAATRLFDTETTRPYRLAAAVEFIHTATLLHDDVVDESDQRRGKPSANTVFGNQSSVLVGDFLFSRAFELMVEDGSIDVLRILSNAAAVITEGEVLQLSIQSKLETTLDQYLEVIAAKTAVLFAAACEIGPVIAGQPESIQKALKDYGHHLGMVFQIADDLLDYQADEAQLGKTVGDDFREGKMTSPVIYALQNATPDEKSFWKRTFEDHNQSESDLETAKSIIKSHKADEKALELAHSYVDAGIQSLSALPPTPLKATLESLIHFALYRPK
ncbi:MAG: farnesyltranstransferase [Alphaproteobacteria bacterium RIFCSPHIGHO2_12_FULL_45_9]|nr:MAG: farnesyltranstransferase [Alphaproteobacteria bacterium RIFCSPHIGHO2_02_FULL_46_13]OFW93984.1 MAG: farnesyltranstransferase [Alphaproteobacteria bacterium RIFCSPHIGHO2_12_FULL_45_9]